MSLNDCLACSGCVTSAETVLITQQSHEELQKVLDANKVSSGISPSSPQHTSSGETHPVHPSGFRDSCIFRFCFFFFGSCVSSLTLEC